MGVIGTTLICLGFGLLLCLADAFFPPDENRTLALLRAAWLLYLSAQVMYGSPQHALVAGFPLLVGTLAVVGCGKHMILKATPKITFCSTNLSRFGP